MPQSMTLMLRTLYQGTLEISLFLQGYLGGGVRVPGFRSIMIFVFWCLGFRGLGV